MNITTRPSSMFLHSWPHETQSTTFQTQNSSLVHKFTGGSHSGVFFKPRKLDLSTLALFTTACCTLLMSAAQVCEYEFLLKTSPERCQLYWLCFTYSKELYWNMNCRCSVLISYPARQWYNSAVPLVCSKIIADSECYQMLYTRHAAVADWQETLPNCNCTDSRDIWMPHHTWRRLMFATEVMKGFKPHYHFDLSSCSAIRGPTLHRHERYNFDKNQYVATLWTDERKFDVFLPQWLSAMAIGG